MRLAVTHALALAAAGLAAAPAPAQTMLDKLVARIAKPKGVPSAIASADAALAPTADARHGPVTGFDVAGIRLHASAADVRAAMQRAGYRITFAGDGPTFEQEVATEAARRRGVRAPDVKQAGTHNLNATGPHQESLIVDFMQAPGGSEVADIVLTVPAEAMNSSAFRQQMIDKYGRPDFARPGSGEMSWCSPETVRNCGLVYAPSGPLDNQYPLLTSTALDGGGHLHLQIGETAFPALAAAKEQAIERLVPKTTRAAF